MEPAHANMATAMVFTLGEYYLPAVLPSRKIISEREPSDCGPRRQGIARASENLRTNE